MALTKDDINAYVGALTNETQVMHKELADDSLLIYVTYPKKPEWFSVSFSKRADTKREWDSWPYYQFYYLNNELIFILQISRDAKRGATYFLRNGYVFDCVLHKELPYLMQDEIDKMSAAILLTKQKVNFKSRNHK